MKKNFNVIALILFLIFSNKLMAQHGDYLITNHVPDINNIDNTNFQILQDRQGLMYFANRSGVLVYDGVEWDFYNTPGAALALKFGPEGETFVGCLNDFGRIGYQDNTIKYISMSSRFGKSIGMIYQVVNAGHKVIFVSENCLYIYDETDKKITTHKIENPDNYYNMLFTLDSTLYSNISTGAIEILNKDLIPDSTFFLPDSSNLAFIRKNDETGKILAGTYNGDIYSIDKDSIRTLPCSDYFTSNNIQLVDGYWYNKEKFVIGTIEKGCLILDLKGKRIKMDTVDFDNGLPDNEVSALFVDNSHGIWVAHEFGLSRIAPEIPIRSFSHYPGLQGNLFSLKRFNDRLYVSTSIGVFYLDEIKTYRNTVYYVKNNPEGNKSRQNIGEKRKTTSKGNTEVSKKKKGRRGFLGLFRVRKSPEKEEGNNNPEEAQRKNTSKPGFFKRLFSRNRNETDRIKGLAGSKGYVRHVRRTLQSVEYMYKPVDGIKAKCKQLITYHGKLLAVSNSGVYEINGDEGTNVINEPTRYVYCDTVNDQLIMAGYDRTVKTYRLVGDLWVELQEVPFNEIITSLGMDLSGNLWLTSPSHLYKVELTDSEFKIDDTYSIPNQLIDIPLMSNIDGKYYFIYSMGYFYYDGDSIHEDQNYKVVFGRPVKYLQSPDGLVWIYNGKTWNRINADGKVESFEYLSLFPDMRFISYDPGQDVYDIITASNKTYLYDHYLGKKMQPGSDLILRRITTNNGLIVNHNKIILSYEDNELSFKFSEPDYLGLLKVEYQYKLVNQMKVWSEWSPVNNVNLNYLQPGKYVLMVRARDSFGRINESKVYNFKVKPPYWKQPWFYAVEIIFLGSLILLVKRLRRSNVRYQFLVDGLGILTLIIILALIQSTIQIYFNIKSTPVADFIVNVVVAIIAFPLEEQLRKLLI